MYEKKIDLKIGDMQFGVNNETPILKITSDGEIFVHGKKIADDIEVYHALKEICGVKQ